jgi:hypothetical protein
MTGLADLPQPTLREAARGNGKIWAFCPDCGHGERLDAWQVAKKVGRDMTMREVARHLKCRRCSSRQTLAAIDPGPSLLREGRQQAT